VAYPCPHAIQLPEVAANVLRQHKVLSPLHRRAVLQPRGHDKRLRGTVDSCVRALGRAGSEVLLESDREDDRASPLGTASLDGSLKAREREDSIGPPSPPSSQPSLRASFLGSRNGSATSLTRIGGAFRSRSRLRNTSSDSGSGSGSGNGGSSRHNSHVLVSHASLALGRVRAHNLIQGIGGASRSSIELVLGHMPSSPSATGTVRLGDMSDVDGSKGALSKPESIRLACPSFAAPVACCNGAPGCVPIRLRAIRDGRRFQYRRRRPPPTPRLQLLRL
jgi:hypothetical protein